MKRTVHLIKAQRGYLYPTNVEVVSLNATAKKAVEEWKEDGGFCHFAVDSKECIQAFPTTRCADRGLASARHIVIGVCKPKKVTPAFAKALNKLIAEQEAGHCLEPGSYLADEATAELLSKTEEDTKDAD